MRKPILFFLTCSVFAQLICTSAAAQQPDGYEYQNTFNAKQNAIITENQFNGYTNHWQDTYKKWVRYGNLFKMSVPDITPTIIQNKIDIAESLQIPGFRMQEGFMYRLLNSTYHTLENPSAAQINNTAAQGNILIFRIIHLECKTKVGNI